MLTALIIIAAFGVAQGASDPHRSRPPELLNGDKVIEPEDYPQDAAAREEHGTVTTLLRVSERGRVTACVVTESSGHTALDARSCALFGRRARFRPATDTTGTAVLGEYRIANLWGINEHQPRIHSELTLNLPTLPAGYRSALKARLVYQGTGKATACEITRTSGSDIADQSVCAYLMDKLAITAFSSGADEVPALAIRYATVNLRRKAP